MILIGKGTARGGGRRGVQADSARLVSRRGDVSGGVADADERAGGGGALRRGAREDGGDAGGTHHRGEVEAGQWQEADLKTRPKGDSVKVALAARLRAETTMTVGWIAERLAMGTRGYLNHLLYRRRKLGGE